MIQHLISQPNSVKTHINRSSPSSSERHALSQNSIRRNDKLCDDEEWQILKLALIMFACLILPGFAILLYLVFNFWQMT
ncbi:hypothetical protein NHH03_06320 [Stieleria sp. TO1_6]|uniref:hypothetical protein n=1 Tax=Stieleria tagensis TaxID=2956795 RepID=UPI00209AB03A|nr:hypothetical protein [Stieleria tagensis]MCO8121345.1 hypothetical protein [Stieleria tagensis]